MLLRGKDCLDIVTSPKWIFKAISENDLIGLSNWHAYVRLLINGNVNFPFNMRTILPEKRPRPEVVPQIWEYSRKHYARPLTEVEAEIQEAWIGKKEGTE